MYVKLFGPQLTVLLSLYHRMNFKTNGMVSTFMELRTPWPKTILL